MSSVHPSAILDGDITLGEDVEIGPHCVLRGPLEIGAGTRLIGHVYLHGPLTLGERNLLYPFATIGFAPQARDFDVGQLGAGIVIGDGNTFRESVTIHRATSREQPGRIGNDNYWMVNSHAGHDCVIGNGCTFANDTLLAGGVSVEDHVTTGGDVSIHQFCRIGRGAMVSGSMAMNRDLLPFLMLTQKNQVGSVNLVGMRRLRLASDQIKDVKWIFKTLYRAGLTRRAAIAELQTRAERALVAETLEFISRSKRGLCLGAEETKRGTIAGSRDFAARESGG